MYFPNRAASPEQIEVISRLPAQAPARTPLLFVHGAFAGAWCWEDHFLDWFAARGHPAYALSLRGHAGSSGHERLLWSGLAEFVEDVAGVAAGIGGPLVLVGHSMGGMVVQKYLERQPAAAAVLMASVPPSGLAGSMLQLLWRDPVLWTEMGLVQAAGPHLASRSTARRSLFSVDVPEALVAKFANRSQPESQRVIADMLGWDLPDVARVGRTPLLVLGAADDALVPVAEVHYTARRYGAECEVFSRLAHAMMCDSGWRRVAEYLGGWLDRRGL